MRHITRIIQALNELEELGGSFNTQEYIETLSTIQKVVNTRKKMALEVLQDEIEAQLKKEAQS